MLKRIALAAASVFTVAALAASAAASSLVLYQNDFSTRTSLGPIGGVTTFTSYTAGNLIGTQDATTGNQDSWIRRGTGTAAAVVANDAGNKYVAIGPSSSSYAHAYQKIGSTVTLAGDVLHISIDMSSPSAWNTSLGTHGQYVFLGDDFFYAGQDDFTRWVASVFGFQYDSGSTKFVVRPGGGDGTYSTLYGGSVTMGKWYRFVADLVLSTNTYTLNIYDLGTAHPTLDTLTPGTPVQTFTDVHFVRDIGSTSSDLRGITAIGLSTYRNTTGEGKYDNITMTIPEPGTITLLALAGLCLLPLGRRLRSAR